MEQLLLLKVRLTNGAIYTRLAACKQAKVDGHSQQKLSDSKQLVKFDQ